ncbi:hypothetical protein [Acidovorax sp. NCPPB 4044]|uniref:hypothetical protein n=1 Tax=Acidovorax sp. NCPPB 4044 TaxID=2940490 RepID=UPI0023040268|nr:hypothetical protein [Acidovorax sp. NCPPB 4044]MDA8523279.1 hypothetical protein [Acidovorax sp. NCPPB 4044]
MRWRRSGGSLPARTSGNEGRRARIGSVLAEGVQVVAGGGALFSASAALALGKVALAALLALVGFGICVRLARHRRAVACTVPAVAPGRAVALSVAAAVLAVLESALLVEATGLPVRHDQPGFEPSNWAWVLGALAVLFWGQRALLLRWARHRGAAAAGATR